MVNVYFKVIFFLLVGSRIPEFWVNKLSLGQSVSGPSLNYNLGIPAVSSHTFTRLKAQLPTEHKHLTENLLHCIPARTSTTPGVTAITELFNYPFSPKGRTAGSGAGETPGMRCSLGRAGGRGWCVGYTDDVLPEGRCMVLQYHPWPLSLTPSANERVPSHKTSATRGQVYHGFSSKTWPVMDNISTYPTPISTHVVGKHKQQSKSTAVGSLFSRNRGEGLTERKKGENVRNFCALKCPILPSLDHSTLYMPLSDCHMYLREELHSCVL